MLSRRRIAFSHVIYTSGFFFLTVAFALIAVVALTLRFAGGPQVLKVAVGPADGDNAKLIGAIARHLERDGGRIRFVVLPVDDLAQSTKALEQGRADLAVIRSDIAIPQNGATVVILHNDIAVLAAPAGSRKSKTYQQRACASRATTISTRLGWPRYGSPLTKLVGRSAISAMSSKQSHCLSPMPRWGDHRRPNLTAEGALSYVDIR
jgi:DNA-binding transcriptional LysR family regulator